MERGVQLPPVTRVMGTGAGVVLQLSGRRRWRGELLFILLFLHVVVSSIWNPFRNWRERENTETMDQLGH